MAEQQLLLMVQMTCAREHLEPFTLWYNSHLPNLLRIPGYQWAQRYVNLDGGTRFTAFYGIRSVGDLPSLLQFGGPNLHPIAASEYSVFSTLRGRQRSRFQCLRTGLRRSPARPSAAV